MSIGCQHFRYKPLEPPIKGKDGRIYKWIMTDKYLYLTGIIPAFVSTAKFLEINQHGVLTMKKDYAWDGASGPAKDTKTAMRGSGLHDALYQFI